jgi:outer membrane protein
VSTRSSATHVLALVCALVSPAVTQAQAASAPAPVASSSAERRLTLADALEMARVHRPTLRKARADVQVASARVDLAHAPLYPQLDASASYRKTTANFTPRPGATPSSLMADADPDFDLYDYFELGVTARQLVYDFGHTYQGANAAEAEHEAQAHTERATRLQVEEQVRVSFFEARATKALLFVARETLENHERHFKQIETFVRVGARAAIDLARTRTDLANARVGLINAENAYIASKANLSYAIGAGGGTDFEVSDESVPPIDGEDGGVEDLLRRALSNRPELAALERRIRAQELTRSSARGSHWPSLSVFTGMTEAGVELDDMAWNWNAGVSLTWPLFQGGAVAARVDEAGAALAGLSAAREDLYQQVRLEVDQARLAVRAAKATIAAAEESVVSARDLLRLAEGRYQAGAGSALELADAQLAVQNAAAQRVQADYNLASARARMLRAIGR